MTGETEKNHDNPQSRGPAAWPKSEQGTTHIQVQSVHTTPTCFISDTVLFRVGRNYLIIFLSEIAEPPYVEVTGG